MDTTKLDADDYYIEEIGLTVKQIKEKLEDKRLSDLWYYACDAAGIDNWQGYGHAEDIYEEWINES